MVNDEKSGIYKITNILNGKIYIGSAVNFARRWRDHRKSLNAGKHYNVKLQKAWTKYGIENFDFSIVELVDNNKNLLEREQFWMDECRVIGPLGYNIQPTAGSMLGYKHSQIAKEKCRASKIGIPKPPHVLEALRKANIGKKRTPEHIAKIVSYHIGRKKSPESIAKTAAAHLGSKRSAEARSNISKAMIGKKSPFLGKTHSEETKAKISLAKKGNKTGFRKLSESNVVEIRAMRAAGETYKAIGTRFGVTGECISALIRGFTWKS